MNKAIMYALCYIIIQLKNETHYVENMNKTESGEETNKLYIMDEVNNKNMLFTTLYMREQKITYIKYEYQKQSMRVGIVNESTFE